MENVRGEMSKAGVGDPTVIKALGMVQMLMRRAVSRDMVERNPVREVAKPRQRRDSYPVPLSPESVEAIREHLLARPLPTNFWGRERAWQLICLRDATLVSVLAYGGLRPDEAIRLEVERIATRRLDVYAFKKEQPRQVKLLAQLAQDLRERRLASGIRAGLVFPRYGRKTGDDDPEWRDHDWRNWRKRTYKPAAAAAGVTGDMRPYRLRGSFISLLLWEGRSLPYVAEQPATPSPRSRGTTPA